MDAPLQSSRESPLKNRDHSRGNSASDSHGCCSCTSGGHRRRHLDTGDRTPAGAAVTPGGGGRGTLCDCCGYHGGAAASSVSLLSGNRLAAGHRSNPRWCADAWWIANCRRCWNCCYRALSWWSAEKGRIINMDARSCRSHVAYLRLNRLLGIVPRIVDVIEIIHAIVVRTTHVVDL